MVANETELRARAAALRRVAAAIDGCSARDLYRRAGEDTWIGPTPARGLEALRNISTSLRNAADELRTTARAIDRLAEQAGSVNAR